MTERIVTAMDYHIDSFTKAYPKPFKQRMLGDIDGKYNVADQLLEVSYQTFPDPSRKLDERTEKKIVHQPLAGTVFRGIEEDLERLIRSPERARSSTAPTRSARLNSSTSRPLTSVSQASARSSTVRRHLGNLPDSLSKFTPHASVKRLAFTSPAIKIGAVDVRDEITDEIVNKPMTLRWGNLKTQSAPPGGRARSGGVRSSSAARSAKWTSASSSRRAKTSYSKRRRIRAKSSEKLPGPFMTIKVPERDMWVVSNSTPITFFDNYIPGNSHQADGMKNAVKFNNWENTAESVPKAEQSSPPRHERLLGPPAQFSPTIKWLRYDHSAPPKKPPVLTPFKGTLDGKYYHLESEQFKRVNHHMTASPGVRIARNGEVVSHSMKLESLADEEDATGGSESESDADVSSLIPAKLAAKIKQHYGTPEDESTSECEEEEKSDEEETDYEEETDHPESSPDEISKNSPEAVNSGDKTDVDTEDVTSETTTPPETDHDEVKDVNEQTDNDSEVSSMSDEESVEFPDRVNSGLTKDSVQLLDRITGHNQPNPFIDSSDHTSTTSYDSHEMEGYLDSLGVKVDFHQIGNDVEKESDVWRVLENVNPMFWMSQSRHKKMAILRRLRKQGEAEHNGRSTREAVTSTKTTSDATEEVIIPLCWEDELVKANKIVKGRDGIPNVSQKWDSSALPVVYHQGKRNILPTATVTSSMKHPVLEQTKSARSTQSVNFNINISRGYKVPMSTPRSNRSDKTTSVDNSRQTSASSSRERKIMDLAHLLQVTPDSLPAKTSPVKSFTHNVVKDKVTIVLQNGSGKNEEDQSSKDATHAPQSKTSNDVNGTDSEKVQQAVESLDFTRLDVDSAGDSNLQSSQRFSDLKSSERTSPQNTPTTHFSQYHSANGFIPRSPATGQLSDPKRFGEREQNMDHPPSMGSRPMSVFPYDEPKGFGNKLQLKSPTRGAINVEHNDSRPKGPRMSSLHHNSAGSKFLKPSSNKLNVSSSNEFSENNLIIPTVQLRVPNSPNVPMKTADFIQITQSLQIRDRPVMESDRSSLTGNKMFDSYMHELAAQSSDRRDEPIDDKGVVGRGLGGNSGKGGIPPLPRSVRKNLASCQTNQQVQSPNISPFTPQAGRRSGLTMVPQDGSRRIGPFGLGVKGDQVRLNIDKNIHNIYRDLGVLKSPGRPHISSAKSQSSQKDDITVTIPSVPASERDAKIDSPTSEKAREETKETTSEAKPNTRPSSSNPSVVVQDSGTQWSSRSAKPGDEIQQGISLHNQQINRLDSTEKIERNEQLEKENDPEPLSREISDRKDDDVEAKPVIEIPEPEQIMKITSKPSNEKLETLPQPINGVNDADEVSDDGQSEDNDIRGVTRVTVNMQPE